MVWLWCAANKGVWCRVRMMGTMARVSMVGVRFHLARELDHALLIQPTHSPHRPHPIY